MIIHYDHWTLNNGLNVICHVNPSSTLATINVLYHVGSSHEPQNKTGLAHLCEHLMFGASQHVLCYDKALQRVGGDNNAYTTKDVTHYHCTLPPNNIETGFWLESDRMLGLKLTQQSVDIQKKVVIEEFKECYLNQPYGDIWLHLLPLAYGNHPYHWPTIGKSIMDIESITLEDVKSFFAHHYIPQKATLVVAGNVQCSEIKRLSKKWFESIPANKNVQQSKLHIEDIVIPQVKAKYKQIKAKGEPGLFKAYTIPGIKKRVHISLTLYAAMLNNQSSKFYQKLIKEKQYCSSYVVYILDYIHTSLFVIEVYSQEKNRLEIIDNMIAKLLLQEAPLIDTTMLSSVKNKMEMQLSLAHSDILYVADTLAMGHFLGNMNNINEQVPLMQSIHKKEIQNAVDTYLVAENCTSISYL